MLRRRPPLGTRVLRAKVITTAKVTPSTVREATRITQLTRQKSNREEGATMRAAIVIEILLEFL